MDIQTRKIEFIQEFITIANGNLLEKFEDIKAIKRKKIQQKNKTYIPSSNTNNL